MSRQILVDSCCVLCYNLHIGQEEQEMKNLIEDAAGAIALFGMLYLFLLFTPA
jgi:hypothetical protein